MKKVFNISFLFCLIFILITTMSLATSVVETEIKPAKLSVDVDNYGVELLENNVVQITATGLVEHENAAGDDGHWIGFALEAPERVTDVKYVFSETEITEQTELTEQGLESKVVGEKPGIAFYADAGDENPKIWVKLQWYEGEGENKVPFGSPFTYKMDLENVILKLDEIIEPEEAKFTANNCVDSYNVELLSGDTVKITAEGLIEHENGNGNYGHWIGFALKAPDNATEVAYIFDKDPISESAKLPKYELEENVVGENPGVAFYTDMSSENPKKYVKVQWYEGAGKLGEAKTYVMDLTDVELKQPEITPAKLSIVNNCDVNIENNIVEISATELIEHKNGAPEPQDGHWVGFAITAPYDATGVRYIFTSNKIELERDFNNNDEYELEEKVNGDKPGVAFYADAGAKAPKKYVKVQWKYGSKYGKAVTYEMDLENVTLKLDENKKTTPKPAKVSVPDYTYEIDVVGNTVKITADNLVSHKNYEDKLGHWIGFALEAPDGATNVKYAFATTEQGVATLDKEGLEYSVVGDKSGIAFYADKGEQTPKTCVKVQWYQGECKLGNAETYNMDLTNVKLPEITKAKLSGSNYDYNITVEGNVVKVTAQDIIQHKNLAGTLGCWVGFALTAPDTATKVKYTFATEQEFATAAFNEYDLEPSVNGEKAGVAFYADASSQTPKTYVKVQWKYSNGKYGQIAIYKIDLSGVTCKTHKVEFDTFDRVLAPQTQNVLYGTVASRPDDPSLSGYTFGGWYKESSCTNLYDFATPVTSDIKLYAKWTVVQSSSGGGGGGGGGSASDDTVETYKITVTEGKNGSISPNGTVKVEKGENQRFKIKPDKGYEIEDVIVDGKSVGVVDSYIFKNVKKKHTIKATFQKIKEETKEEIKEDKSEEKPEVKPSQTNKKYLDVKENAWYVTPIQYVTRNNLMSGVGNDKFDPSNNGTRAMFVTILYNKEGKPTVTGNTGFKDVIKGAWYEGPIAWAKANKIANGYQDGTFGPNKPVTREQLAVMLYNYAKANGKVSMGSAQFNFIDKDNISTWAQEAMKWCVSNKIINGKGNNKLDPRGLATRAEIATMIMNFCEM